MEQQIENGGSSSSSPSSLRDPNPCPICLGRITDESFLDQCFHKFCYNCIVHWTKVVASKYSVMPTSVRCPICKTESFSIIHGCDGVSFQQRYVNEDVEIRSFFTKLHKYRLQIYYCETGTLTDFNTMRYWKLHKYLQESRWVHQWMRREIQALIQEEDVGIIIHHILGVVDSFRRNEQKDPITTLEAKRQKFKSLVSEAARPFLIGRTERFVNELEMFLASGLTIDAYDKVYLKHLGWEIPGITEDEEELLNHAPEVPNLCFLDDGSEYTD